MAMEKGQHKIMVKTLPEILDELDSSIEELKATIKEAKEAITEAKAAAGEAREAGEQAAERAKQIATGAVGKLAGDLADAENRLRQQLLEAQSDLLTQLKAVLEIATAALNEHRAFRGAIIRGVNFTGEEINKPLA